VNFNHDRTCDFSSRRSVVLSPNVAVASSQPLATEAGVQVLRAGGSAADAAVAVASALQVTQACSTGLGGDAFCLYYEADGGRVHAYNGSGRSPAALTLDVARRAADAEPGAGRDPGVGGRRGSADRRADGAAGTASPTHLPDYHAHTVTVPGAADAWAEVHRRFGRLALGDVLAPAIRFAEEGFSLEPMAAGWWAAGAERQLSAHRHGGELMLNGRAPRVGERFRNPGLASVFRELADGGRDAFYRGWVAERIVAELEHEGGVMTLDDLAAHRGEWVEPVSLDYDGYRVWECPPNGQGLAALLALGTYRTLRDDAGANEAMRIHYQIEAMRLAFADAARFVADPDFAPAPLAGLLDPEYLARRAALVDPARAMAHVGPGIPASSVGDDTVYFSVVDADGNGCSFINSNFMGFGTGIVPRGCGFSLQNRGRGFVLEAGHANALEPRKRPYHTIIPGLLTSEDGGLAAVFGVMGGMMQPQGHLQVVCRLVDERLDPQSALDAPRFQLADGDPDGTVLVEDSFPGAVVEELRSLGHDVAPVSGARRALFGLGQVIATGDERMLWSGSDPRGDGYAGGF